MRLSTLYLIRLHVPVALGASAVLTLVLLAGASLPVAEHLLAFSAAEQALVTLAALSLRCLLAALPFAALIATVAVGLGLRTRGERVALAQCGVRRRDRLAVALGLGLATSLVLAEAGRELLPALRQVGRRLRGDVAAGVAAGVIERLESARTVGDLAFYVDRAAGQRLEDIVLWRAPGQPKGQVVRAAAGTLRPGTEPGRVTLELEGAQLVSTDRPVFGPFRVVRADRLAFTLRVDDADGGPRRGEAPLAALWSARSAGATWTRDRIDRELSERAADALLALAMALAGFAIAEVTPDRREGTAWAAALAVAALPIVAEPLGRSARGLLGLLSPWLGTGTVAAVGALALLCARAEEA